MNRRGEFPWLELYAPSTPICIRHLLGKDLVQLIEESCVQHASRVAFYSLGGALSYAHLQQLSKDFCAWLLAQGLQPGERVALMMPNLMQYVVALIGVLRAGGVVVTCNPLYTPRELRALLQDAQPRFLVVARPFVSTAHAAMALCQEKGGEPFSSLALVVTNIGDLQSGFQRHWLNCLTRFRGGHSTQNRRLCGRYRSVQTYSFLQVLRQGRKITIREPKLQPDQAAFLLYTGGTTGRPKGVVLSHENMVANLYQVSTWLAPKLNADQEMVLTVLPMYHIFSLLGNCLLFLFLGASNVLIPDGRQLSQVIKAFKRYPITAFTGVNTLFKQLLLREEFRRLHFTHLNLVIGGGAAVEESVATQWEEVTGQPLLQAYGLTETAPAVCMNPVLGQHKKAALGLPLPSTEVRIMNEQGAPMPFYACGEIGVRGPQVMQGYFHAADNQSAFTGDGFFRTGDMGYMDEQGFVYLQERKNDIINVSGFQVFPTEIEAVIGQLPEVSAVAVIGVPDQEQGECIYAFVQLGQNARGAQRDLEKRIRQLCQHNLTQYKMPAKIIFVSDLPVSAVGKVLRRELRSECHFL